MHNLILILLSAGMAGSAVYWAVKGGYNFWGNAFKPSEREMALTIYVFYMSKFYEFFDTVCAVLPREEIEYLLNAGFRGPTPGLRALIKALNFKLPANAAVRAIHPTCVGFELSSDRWRQLVDGDCRLDS